MRALGRLRVAWWALCGRAIVANCHFHDGVEISNYRVLCSNNRVLFINNRIGPIE